MLASICPNIAYGKAYICTYNSEHLLHELKSFLHSQFLETVSRYVVNICGKTKLEKFI